MGRPDSDQPTRERILQAAGTLFAEKGFEGATIRDICEAAGANVASVNYHFRDKETLYAEVVERSLRARTEAFPIDGGGGRVAEERLPAFVRAFLRRRFDRASPTWWGTLLAREMRRPRDLVRPIVDKEKRANRELLTGIVRELAGPDADDVRVDRCVSSVFGQVLYYFHGHHGRGARAGAELSAQEVDDIAEHITRFSLGGMAQVRETPRHGRSR